MPELVQSRSCRDHFWLVLHLSSFRMHIVQAPDIKFSRVPGK